ncbi:MAG TPA: zinc-finger-containing protein [Fluviicoccus sp.]|nr:zinc-finger-containing protein [Fluviicoccus sp.]
MSTAMQEAFAKVGVMKPEKTPWNPSRKATARVKGALPAPTTCPHCGSEVELCSNAKIYGREYGDWPWAYRCTDDDCNSYVGVHPFTNIPLGTLATFEMREARKEAKAEFNPIWQSRQMTRSEAYAWLAGKLGIPVGECHIGWFDEDQCERVIEVCQQRKGGKA